MKNIEAFGRHFKLRHEDGRWLMIPARVMQGPAVFCDDISSASCYVGSDAFRIVGQMRRDGYSVAVTGYTGTVLTPFVARKSNGHQENTSVCSTSAATR